MAASISPGHPLRQFFASLVYQTFNAKLGYSEQKLSEYISNLLVDFAHTEQLYRLKNSEGNPIEEVADMLMEGDVMFNAGSFNRERQVHKHIGDFTLFWAGVYPEALPKLRAMMKKDHLINYVNQGKQSYYIVSTFNLGDWREEADIYRELSERFELFMYGLRLVRDEWEQIALERRSV